MNAKAYIMILYIYIQGFKFNSCINTFNWFEYTMYSGEVVSGISWTVEDDRIQCSSSLSSGDLYNWLIIIKWMLIKE